MTGAMAGDVPQQVTGWPEKFRNQGNFRFHTPPDISDAVWWNRRFVPTSGLYPAELAEQLFRGMPGELHVVFNRLHAARDVVELVAVGREKGEPVWEAGFTLEGSILRWDDIATDRRGMGLGRRMGRNVLDVATRLRSKRLEICAQATGSFLWAQAGFIPDDATWKGVRADLHRRVARLRLEVTAASLRILDRVLMPPKGQADPGDIRIVAALRDEIVSPDPRHPSGSRKERLGKELLIGLCWTGGLDLSNEQQRRRLEEWLAS